MTEQLKQLEHGPTRTVFDRIRADTASLAVSNKDISDTASVRSLNPSVHLNVDSILLQHPNYIRVYGDVCAYDSVF